MNKQQLANKIWASANRMRSKIDANEYKDYILGLVFYKFLSDNEVNYILKDMKNASDEEKQQALMSLVENYDDENSKIIIDYCKNNIGYFIEYKNLFSTWLLPESTFTVSDLSVALNSFDRLVSPNYKPVYDGIFKTLQAGLSKLGENPASQTRALKDLIKLIKDIPTDGSQDYDVLGYVYEYLISNFAANAGKKAGEFYTPHEVAILMSEIVAEHHKDKRQIEIYDPTSGSGSLLITIGKSVGRHIADKNRVKYYAQELKENTYNLTRMNLVMRGIQPSNINTRCADSLDEDWPIYKAGAEIGQPLYVDAVVSNPPYSQHWDPTDRENDARFKDYGVAPKSKADYAFLLHELHHLKPDGILTIVLPHGVLFRGGEEEQIRTNLVEKNNIDAIIGLPANIFFGTGIPTLIMVLKQHRDNDDVLIIDASKGFVKDGKQNKLRACDIKKIADTIRERKDVPGFAKKVSREMIRENGYNLNIPRYVDSSEPAEQYDIYATMFGGIPNEEIDSLQKYWEAFPSLRNELFKPELDKPYSSLKVEDIKATIENNTDVKWFSTQFTEAFSGFADTLHQKLIDNVKNVRELQAQDEIATDIFRRLSSIPLVDKYAAYQALADNWQGIISDIETIQEEGLDAVRVVETAYKIVKKNDEDVEVPDGLKGRIIPFELVQKDKFQDELDAIDDLQLRVEAINSELDEVRDGFTEEELEVYCDSEKDNAFDKKRITADAKPKADIEIETKSKLQQIVALWEEQTKTNKQIKIDKQVLIDKTVAAIENLSDNEVSQYLHLKWIEPICDGINNTLVAVLQILESSIQQNCNKYAISYNQIDEDVASAKSNLTGLIEQLVGDEYAIQGLMELIKSQS
jgi:type I restriction enzyme M protein